MQLMQRYKTGAERAFHRSWNAIRGLRRDVMREQKELIEARQERADWEEKARLLESENQRAEKRIGGIQEENREGRAA